MENKTETKPVDEVPWLGLLFVMVGCGIPVVCVLALVVCLTWWACVRLVS